MQINSLPITQLIGRVTVKPKLKVKSNQRKYVMILLYVQDNYSANLYPVMLFGKRATAAAKKLNQGDLVQFNVRVDVKSYRGYLNPMLIGDSYIFLEPKLIRKIYQEDDKLKKSLFPFKPDNYLQDNNKKTNQQKPNNGIKHASKDAYDKSSSSNQYDSQTVNNNSVNNDHDNHAKTFGEKLAEQHAKGKVSSDSNKTQKQLHPKHSKHDEIEEVEIEIINLNDDDINKPNLISKSKVIEGSSSEVDRTSRDGINESNWLEQVNKITNFKFPELN